MRLRLNGYPLSKAELPQKPFLALCNQLLNRAGIGLPEQEGILLTACELNSCSQSFSLGLACLPIFRLLDLFPSMSTASS